jgi:predicted dehydrogenase
MSFCGKPLRLAVIGAGRPNIATSSHLPAIKKISSVKLAALCDILEDGVKEQAIKYNVPYYIDYQEILENKDIDAIDICTPDHLHCEHIIMAAKHGKHIFCEKPFAINMQEAKAIRDAIEANNVIFMSGHHMRFTTMCRKIHETISQGTIGKVIFGKVIYKGAFFPYEKGSLYYKKASGGQFVHNGPHYVDKLFYLMGQTKAEKVFPRKKSVYVDQNDSLETSNFTSVMLKFADGAIGYVEQNLTILNPRGYPTKEDILIVGTNGVVQWNTLDNAPVVKYLNGKVFISDPRPMMDVSDDPYASEINHFAECVSKGKSPETDIELSYNVLDVCLRAIA